MCFTFIKIEVECTLVLSECTAIVVVFDSHRGQNIFSLPRVVPCFPLLGLTPCGLFMGLSSTLIYTSELILCFTICVPSATQHNIHMYHCCCDLLSYVFMASWLLLAIDFLSIPEGSYSSWMIISSSSEQSIDFMIKDR